MVAWHHRALMWGSKHAGPGAGLPAEKGQQTQRFWARNLPANRPIWLRPSGRGLQTEVRLWSSGWDTSSIGPCWPVWHLAFTLHETVATTRLRAERWHKLADVSESHSGSYMSMSCRGGSKAWRRRQQPTWGMAVTSWVRAGGCKKWLDTGCILKEKVMRVCWLARYLTCKKERSQGDSKFLAWGAGRTEERLTQE